MRFRMPMFTGLFLLAAFAAPLPCLAAAPTVPITSTAVDPADTADAPAPAESTTARLAHAVVMCGWGLSPLALASALFIALVVKRRRDYRRSELLPGGICHELEAVAHGSRPDCTALHKLVRHDRTLLGKLTWTALQTAGRPLANRMRLIDEAIARELSDLKQPSRWLDAIYQCSCLVGLLSAVVGLVATFSRPPVNTEADRATINASIAAALVATGLGVALAIAAKIAAESFQQIHQRLIAEVGRRLVPLIVGLEPADDRHTGQPSDSGSAHLDESNVDETGAATPNGNGRRLLAIK